MRRTVVLQFLLERNKNRRPAASVACRCWGKTWWLTTQMCSSRCWFLPWKDAGSGWQNWCLNPHSCDSPHVQKQSLYLLCTQGSRNVFGVPEFQSWWGGKSPPVTPRDLEQSLLLFLLCVAGCLGDIVEVLSLLCSLEVSDSGSVGFCFFARWIFVYLTSCEKQSTCFI